MVSDTRMRDRADERLEQAGADADGERVERADGDEGEDRSERPAVGAEPEAGDQVDERRYQDRGGSDHRIAAAGQRPGASVSRMVGVM